MTPVLDLTDVSREFRSDAGRLKILDGVSLSMTAGETVAVTGPSGSGKSTLLLIAGTLDQPTSGTVEILREDPTMMTPLRLAEFRNRNIGFIFQEHHLLPQCSVLENVLLPTLAGFGRDRNDKKRATELLERVGLKDRLRHRPGKLSGGERQRVAVCRALINQPPVLLADEQTGSLDPKTADVIGQLLLEMASEHGAALLCVTHSMQLAEKFGRHVRLSEGRIVE